MTVIKKIAHNTIIQIFGKALAVVFALASFGLMTRYLGQDGYGLYATIYGFLAIFGILVDLGLQMTTAQLIADPKNNEVKILSNALTIRLIASVIFLGLAPIIALAFPYEPIIKIGIFAAAVGFVFSSLTSTLISYFQKHLDMTKVVIAESVGKIISLFLVFEAVASNLGLMGIIGAVVFDSLFNFVVLASFALTKIKLRPSFDFTIWKKILSYTWPLALTIALNLIYFKGDIFIMSLILTKAEVGLYAAPYKILEVLINAIYLFLGLLLPLLAANFATKNYNEIKKIIQGSFDFLIILAVPMIIGTYFVGTDLMIAFAGPQFVISGQVIKILILATATIFLAGLFGYVVVAAGRQKEMIKFYAINAVLSIGGYIYFIKTAGIWGAAWMTLATEFFILVTAFYVVKKELNFIPNLKIFSKTAVAAMAMGLILWAISPFTFFAKVIIGAAVYLTVLYLNKGLNKKIILEIVNLKKS